MSIYNSSYLKNLAAQKKGIYEQKLFSARSKTEFDIFLSHSFLDKDEVQGLYQELTDYGYSVYVDWIIDPQLDRNNVTKESATLIRKRMKSSKSLLLAISTNAALSKWMPWELGYVDGHTNKCGIIPVSKEGPALGSFKRAEYLLLYPFLKKATVPGLLGNLWVVESEYKYSPFSNWFSSGIIQENRNTNIFNL